MGHLLPVGRQRAARGAPGAVRGPLPVAGGWGHAGSFAPIWGLLLPRGASPCSALGDAAAPRGCRRGWGGRVRGWRTSGGLGEHTLQICAPCVEKFRRKSPSLLRILVADERAPRVWQDISRGHVSQQTLAALHPTDQMLALLPGTTFFPSPWAGGSDWLPWGAGGWELC